MGMAGQHPVQVAQMNEVVVEEDQPTCNDNVNSV